MLKLSESSWNQLELDAIQTCIENDTYSMGKAVAQFEKEFAAWNGSKYAIMVNSGSSANLLAASVLGFRTKSKNRKHNVIVPALSWSTTYFPWIQSGFNIKFVDIDGDSFNINLGEIEEAIDEDTVGICVPHILGADAGIEMIRSIANSHNLWVVEDACESLGGLAEKSSQKKKLGTFGIMGTYSFFRSHHISTMEGGMLVTDDFETYALAKSMRAHGWGRDVPDSVELGISRNDPWKEKFRFYVPGFNLRPLEMSGAIGSVQLRKLDEFISERRANAQFLQSRISEVAGISLQKQSLNGSWMAFAFCLNESFSESRGKLIENLERCGVETRPVVTGNFVNQPVIKKIRDSVSLKESYDFAEKIERCGFMIANHGRDLKQELERVVEIIQSTLSTK